ncbi:helix-turn-helix domain-containing protein [archaeon]|nr:MAG: helix-turn-helix domain-containing protein [archaeon]
MFNNLAKVVEALQNEGFSTLTTEGSFDIVAKRDDRLLLIKVLTNVDGLSQEQAMSLRAISHFLSAHPFVISVKNNREQLDDNVVYSRFDIPVVTPALFSSILNEKTLPFSSAKGRHTIEVDSGLMKETRNGAGMTLEELADKVGVSKKAIYEIENQRVNPSEETVKKLESALSIKLKKPYEMKTAPMTHLKPKTDFQSKVSREFSRIGIDNSSVYSAPFEIVGKEKFSIITRLSYTVDKGTSVVKKLSGMFSSKAVVIAKKAGKNADGLAVVLESELPEIGSSKELKKLIEEKD